jgi:hypothetical protein
VAETVHTHFLEMDVTLPANDSSLLEVIERAFQQRLEGRGEVLRWAITALDRKRAGTATIQAVVLEYSTPL